MTALGHVALVQDRDLGLAQGLGVAVEEMPLLGIIDPSDFRPMTKPSFAWLLVKCMS
jgi:hypothetical protein